MTHHQSNGTKKKDVDLNHETISLSSEMIEEAIQCGHWAASEIIKRRGCSLSTRCGYFSWKNGRADLTRRSLG